MAHHLAASPFLSRAMQTRGMPDPEEVLAFGIAGQTSNSGGAE
jgi:hypothetical protein